jgi:hypothetical protein
MEEMEEKLKELHIKYTKRTVEDEEIKMGRGLTNSSSTTTQMGS